MSKLLKILFFGILGIIIIGLLLAAFAYYEYSDLNPNSSPHRSEQWAKVGEDYIAQLCKDVNNNTVGDRLRDIINGIKKTDSVYSEYINGLKNCTKIYSIKTQNNEYGLSMAPPEESHFLVGGYLSYSDGNSNYVNMAFTCEKRDCKPTNFEYHKE